MAGYSDLRVGELLDLFAAGALVPGGGAAAAIGSALGASLLMMVAALPRTRTGTPQERAELTAAGAELRAIRDRLLLGAEEDVSAYGEVIAARRLPGGSDGERAVRDEALQRALRAATDAPLQIMQVCQAALMQGVIVATHGSPRAQGDLLVGVDLLLLGVRGAAQCVEGNLEWLRDDAHAASLRAARQQAESAAAEVGARIRVIVLGSTGPG